VSLLGLLVVYLTYSIKAKFVAGLIGFFLAANADTSDFVIMTDRNGTIVDIDGDLFPKFLAVNG